jgi:threonine dehydratase
MSKLRYLDKEPVWNDIVERHEAIASLIHKTPVLQSQSINELSGARIFFKCENFQKVGAFKMRGAASAAFALEPEILAKGLATHSSGNHAQAVARAAQQCGVPSHIVMPSNAPRVKQEATASYGAKISLCEPTLQAREAGLTRVVEEEGKVAIHPYNDYNIIAGQATCAKELLEQYSQIDDLLFPIGGGGLGAGSCLSAHSLNPSLKVWGTEPERVGEAKRSLEAGQCMKNERTDTIADGLRVDIGERNFGIIQKHVDDILLVDEGEIVEAMRLIWERMKIVIEPSCAVPLAAVLRNREVFQNRNLGIILTGGNLDLQHFFEVLQRK